MINSIKIKNFESHKDTNIVLHPGCNVIVGESDEGKSSIIRAIKWNVKNRPQGNGYRTDSLESHKEDKEKITEVTIDFENSGIVSRKRDGFTGGINTYTINNQEPLKALRSDVPDEIKEISRMKSINIQGQHPTEQYFLLADKPGQVAKKLNKVSGLVIMDKAISDINSQVRNCNSMIKMNETEIKEKQEELKNTKWVESAQNFAKKLNIIDTKIKTKENYFDALNKHLQIIYNIENAIKKDFIELDEANKKLIDLKTQNQKIISENRELNILNKLIDALIDNDLRLKATTGIHEALTLLNELILTEKNINQCLSEIHFLKLHIDKLSENKKNISQAEKDFNDAKEKFEYVKEKYQCPVCGRSGK